MQSANLTKAAITILAAALLPLSGQAAGYKFTSFQYPVAFGTVFTAIDDAGRIAGFANNADNPQGILVTAAGSLTTVNLNDFLYAIPASINRLGGIVGTAFDGTTIYMFQNNVNGQAPILNDLFNQTISGINSSFNTVGNFNASSGQAVYAKLRGTYYTLMPAANCTSTHDPSINDSNIVAGSCFTRAGTNIGFTWNRGVYTYIQLPPGATYLQPTSINRSGVVAGFYTEASGFTHGFVYSNGSFTTVDYPGAGVTNTQILGINNSGKIVGSYYGPGLTAFSAIPQ